MLRKHKLTDGFAPMPRFTPRQKPPRPATPKKEPTAWLTFIEGQPIRVTAHTRSEARAMIKKEAGIKKLPRGLYIGPDTAKGKKAS